MSPLAQKIVDTLNAHPHWGAVRVAEHLGTTRATVATTASQYKLRFMSRRDLEDMLDGQAE